MEILKKIREKYNQFMLSTNSINRLLSDKLDDYYILQEQPIPINIGNKIIFIGSLNFENEHKFFYEWAKILSVLSAKIINLELITERQKELLEKCNFELLANGKYLMEFLWMDKKLYKDLCKLIKKTVLKQQQYIQIKDNKELIKWTNCSYGYFKKWCTKEILIQICWLVYVYNFDSVKKNIKIIVEKMNIPQLEETYIPFWLQNLDGLTGQFLSAQAPKLDSVFSDLPNSEVKETEEM